MRGDSLHKAFVPHAPRRRPARLSETLHGLPSHLPPRLQPALAVEADLQTYPMTSSEPPCARKNDRQKEAAQLNAETPIARRVLPLCGPTAGPTSVTRTRFDPAPKWVRFASPAAQFSRPILVSFSAPEDGHAPPHIQGG